MKLEEHDDQSIRRQSPNLQKLLARARARAEHEQRHSLATDTPHYAAAALGQTPYVALPNSDVIVVQRKGGWGC